MSIFLFQIGMDRITAKPTSFAGLAVDLPRSFKVNVSQAGRVPNTIFSGTTQFPEPMEISVTGTFLCSGCESVSDQFNRLLSMAGKPNIDVIGYLPNDCCCTGSSCGQCGNCSGDKPVTWLTTTGIIQSVERGYDLSDANSQYPGSMMEVSFKMILDTYWYPLNPYTWYPQYNIEQYDSFRQDPELIKSIMPTKVEADSSFSFWKRTYEKPYALYNPNLWDEMYKYDDAVSRINLISDGSPITYRVRSPRTRWAAPPTSLYCFENFPYTGIEFAPSISVKTEMRPFYTETFLSAIRDAGDFDDVLDDATTALLINNTLTSVLKLIVTDGLHRPSFILYNDEPVLFRRGNFQPERPVLADWSYPTNNPGELLGLDNIVTITAPIGTKISYLHVFKGL